MKSSRPPPEDEPPRILAFVSDSDTYELGRSRAILESAIALQHITNLESFLASLKTAYASTSVVDICDQALDLLIVEFKRFLKMVEQSYSTLSVSRLSSSTVPANQLSRSTAKRLDRRTHLAPEDPNQVLAKILETLISVQQYSRAQEAFQASRVENLVVWLKTSEFWIFCTDQSEFMSDIDEYEAVRSWSEHLVLLSKVVLPAEQEIQICLMRDVNLSTGVIDLVEQIFGFARNVFEKGRPNCRLFSLLKMWEAITEAEMNWIDDNMILGKLNDCREYINVHLEEGYLRNKKHLIDKCDGLSDDLPKDAGIYQPVINVIDFVLKADKSSHILTDKVRSPLDYEDKDIYFFNEESTVFQKHLMHSITETFRKVGEVAPNYNNKKLQCVFLINNYDFLLHNMERIEVDGRLLKKELRYESTHEKDLFSWLFCEDLLPLLDLHDLPTNPKDIQIVLLDKLDQFTQIFCTEVQSHKNLVLLSKEHRDDIHAHIWQLLSEQYDKYLKKIDEVTNIKGVKFRQSQVEKRISFTADSLNDVITTLFEGSNK